MIAVAVLHVALVPAAFLVGSIPFGYVIARAFYGTDIRREGSGNIGAMNALRTIGKKGAVAVLFLDALKGYLPTFAAVLWHAAPWGIACVAAAAVLGHCFSPWLGWKGGKGVATALGVLVALSWPAALCAVAGWVIGAAATRYSSVGSMLANVLACFGLWWFARQPAFAAYGAFAAILIIYTHRENIGRLRGGTENRIRFGRAKTA